MSRNVHKTGLFVACTILAASLLPCLSNAQKYVSKPFATIRIDREQAGISPWTLPFILADAPDETLLVWDVTEQEFRSADETGLAPGRGVWIYADAEAVVLGGDVLLDPTWTTYLLPGLNVIGAPYPVAINPAESGLAHLPVTPKQHTAEGWPDLLVPGHGIWVDVGGTQAVAWTEVRPFDYSYTDHEQAPVIQAVTILPSDEVELTILGTGKPGEWFEVFYMDGDPREPLDLSSGWALAESGLVPEPDGIARWKTGLVEWMPISFPGIRFYLVGRGDIDSDGDGISDARSRFVLGENVYAAGNVQGAMTDDMILDFALPDEVHLAEDVVASTNSTDRVAGEVHRTGRIIYVDQQHGEDRFSGRLTYRTGEDGPKKTIRGGLAAGESGGRLVIRDGQYRERLDITDQAVQIRIVGRVHLTRPEKTYVPEDYSEAASTNRVTSIH